MNGLDLPIIGLGTYLLGKDTYNIVLKALKMGYRHIDTASLYKNEKAVGKAVINSGICREEIFICTKVQYSDIVRGRESIIKAVHKSLNNMNMTYVDLLLLHCPTNNNVTSWKVLEEIYGAGLARYIGTSNYGPDEIKEILDNCRIKPYVNQIECSPFFFPENVINLCKDNGIKIVAHSCLTKGQKLNNDVIQDIARKHNIGATSVMLQYLMNMGIYIIPMTRNEEHLLENMNKIIALDNIDMGRLYMLKDNKFVTHVRYLNNIN